MSLKKASLAFGVVFLAIGVLGFVPALTAMNADGMPLLLGLFMVGTIHNIIHLVSGIGALVGSKSNSYTKLYFQIFGAVYALVTIVGFIQGNTVLGLIDVNLADNLLHLVIAAGALYLGFGVRSSQSISA
jgi:hypothetical protein